MEISLCTLDDGQKGVSFRTQRSSGKNHEILVPFKQYEADKEGTLAMIEDCFKHWHDWCDEQTVCPLRTGD